MRRMSNLFIIATTLMLGLLLVTQTPTQAQCIIDLESIGDITSESGSTVLCADEGILLPEPAFFVTEFPSACVRWAIYECQPSVEDDLISDGCNLSIVLIDEDGNAANNGGLAFFQGNILPEEVASATFLLIPYLDYNCGDLIFDEDCTGVNLAFDYNEFALTILNPDHPDNADLCGGECAGNAQPNDECNAAIELPLLDGTYGEYSNVCATSVSDPEFPDGDCFFSDDDFDATVWFTFTGSGGTYNISTANCDGSTEDQLNDSQIAIYSGSCGDLTFVDCDDDTNGALAVLEEFATEAGVDYFIVVDGFTSNIGEFCMTVEVIILPPECEPVAPTPVLTNGDLICEDEEIIITAADSPADYSTLIIVSDGSSILESGATDLSFNLVAGDYEVMTVNYADYDEACIEDAIAIGDYPPEFVGCCFDVNTNLSFTVLDPTSPDCLACDAEAGDLSSLSELAVCEGEAILLELEDNNAAPEYTTEIVIGNFDDEIVGVQSELSLDLPIGQYTVVSYNYLTDACPPEIGEAFPPGLDGCCFNLSNEINIEILNPTGPECLVCEAAAGELSLTGAAMVCEGELISLSLAENNAGDEYTNDIVVGDEDGFIVVVQPATDLELDLPPGTYTIINYNNYDATCEALVGENFPPDVLECCFEFSNEVSLTILAEDDPLCAEEICEPAAGTLTFDATEVCLGEALTYVAEGQATDGYITQITVVTQSGIILDGVYELGETLELDEGEYLISLVNYPIWNADCVDPLLVIGGSFDPVDFDDCCVDLFPGGFVTIIANGTDPDAPCFECGADAGTLNFEGAVYCEQDEISFTAEGQAEEDFLSLVLVTDEDGNLVSITDSLDPLSLDNGTYEIQLINYLASQAAEIEGEIVGGSPIPNLEDFCVAFSAIFPVEILAAEDPDCFACEANIGMVTYPTDSAALSLCVGTVSEPILIEDNNTDEDYTTAIVVVDADGFVLDIVAGNTFSSVGLAAGDYGVYVVNYANAFELDVLAAFGSEFPIGLEDITCIDLDIEGTTFTVLAEDNEACAEACLASISISNEDITFCPSDAGLVTLSIEAPTEDFVSAAVVVNADGMIVAVDTDVQNDFSTYESGTYCIYAINYASANDAAVLETVSAGTDYDDALSILAENENLCYATSDDCISINILAPTDENCIDPLEVTNITTTVSDDELTYTVSFDITGGSENYIVDGEGIDASSFTSEAIPCGTPFSVLVTDDIASGEIAVDGDAPCEVPCTVSAGNLPTPIVLPVLCAGDIYTATTAGAVLTGLEGVTYIVCTDPSNAVATLIAESNSGIFSYTEDYVTNQSVYIVAVAGPLNEEGMVDIDAECTDVSNGVELVFLAPITLTIGEYCEWATGDFYVIVSLSGGYPQYDNSLTYSVTGDYANTLPANGEFEVVFEEGVTTSYSFIANDGICDAAGVSNDFFCEKGQPVELLHFTGETQNQGNLLKWATATETDNDYFTLERSSNGIDFSSIGKIAGAGNAIVNTNYQWLDENVPTGTNYYRLLQTDFNGTTTNHGIVVLSRSQTNFGINNVYPVPATNVVAVSFTNPTATTSHIRIYNLAGVLVHETNFNTIAGSNTARFDVADYAAGMYFISINNGIESTTSRFVKK